MRLHYFTSNGKRRVLWLSLFAFVAATYVVVIGAAEVFWYFFAGGFSPLIGGFALVVASLIVVRVVATALFSPAELLQARLDLP